MSKCKWKGIWFAPCTIMATSGYDIRKDSLRIGDSDPMAYCPFCGAPLKKPVVIEVGMFGKFWNDGGLFLEWGILIDIREKESRPYLAAAGGEYEHFTPGLPTGFNQDGTPKELI